MTLLLKCPACGKTFGVEAKNAGEQVLCVACGGRVVVPSTGAPKAATARPAGGQAAQKFATSAPPKLEAPERRSNPDSAPASRRPLVLSIVAICVVLLLGFGGWGLYAATHHSPTRQVAGSGGQQVLALKAEAESLALGGKLKEAHAKYQELELAAANVGDDPETADAVRRARSDADQVYQALLKQNEIAIAQQAARPAAAKVVPAAPPAVRKGGDAEKSTTFTEEVTSPAAQARQTASDGDAQPAEDASSTTQPAPTDAVAETPPPSPATQPDSTKSLAQAPPPSSAAQDSSAAPPATRPSDVSSIPVTDDRIEKAMRHGVDYLLSQFSEGELTPQKDAPETRQQGLDALCVYSLLATSQSLRDDRLDIKGPLMRSMLDRLKSYDLEPHINVPSEPVTYGRSLRAAALAVYDRGEDRQQLQDDVNWLLSSCVDGAYDYDGRFSSHYGDRVPPYRLVGPTNIPGVPPPRLGIPQPGLVGPNQPDQSVQYGPLTARPPMPGGTDGQRIVVPPASLTPPPNAIRFGPSGGVPAGVGTRGVPGTRTPSVRLPGSYSPYGPPLTPSTNNLPPIPHPSGLVDFPWDNSNSQYGLLGVWSGAEVGIPVPERYWQLVEGHWVRCQLKDGQWGYKASDRQGTLSMDCAGVASLLITHEWIQSAQLKAAVGREIHPKPLGLGLEYLERGDNSVEVGGPASHYIGYDLFGVERVGLTSGYKYFGPHDWYRDLSQMILPKQWPNGAWGKQQEGEDSIINTAYTLLFLARGRHPVFMNKLMFSGHWANRPRDIANLTRFASHETERKLNWQVVGLDRDWFDWMDSPVLFMASHKPPVLKDEDYEKLRHFVEAGGLLFTQADASSEAFNKWVPQLAAKVCPGYQLKPLAEDDPLFSTHYKIGYPHMRLLGVSNGSRLLMVHSAGDMAASWQQQAVKNYRDHFRLGMNIFFYAAGKGDLHYRLNTPYIAAPPATTKTPVKVALLQYDGHWDPEPYAWTRFGRAFQWDTGTPVGAQTVAITSLQPGAAPLAHLTGALAHDFSDADAAAIRSYVESGGVLLIDACGGSHAFADSVEKSLFAKAFPHANPIDAPTDHPMFKDFGRVPGTSGQPPLRPFTREEFQGLPPHISVFTAGKGCVIFSPLDITTGLLGTNTWPITGYDTGACKQLMENIVRWAAERARS